MKININYIHDSSYLVIRNLNKFTILKNFDFT